MIREEYLPLPGESRNADNFEDGRRFVWTKSHGIRLLCSLGGTLVSPHGSLIAITIQLTIVIFVVINCSSFFTVNATFCFKIRQVDSQI